jgi:hypothetical protein
MNLPFFIKLQNSIWTYMSLNKPLVSKVPDCAALLCLKKNDVCMCMSYMIVDSNVSSTYMLGQRRMIAAA